LIFRFPGLKPIWADGGYAGKLVEMGIGCSAACPFDRETTTEEPGISGLAVALDRRTHLRLAQPLNRSRRETTEAWIRIAMIH
jgi:hypothetical protein